VAIAAVAVVFAVFSLVRTGSESVFWRLFAPLYAARNALFFSDAESMRAQLATSLALAADREVLRVENEELKRRLGRTASEARILGAILQRPPASPYDTLVIDIGAQDGVVLGAYVSAGGSTLIGRVSQVYATASRITLFSAPGEEHQALLLPRTVEDTALPINVGGQGGGTLFAEVPAGSDVVVGDAVAFPGIGSSFVANITYVDAQEGESFMLLYMKLPLNPLELRYVEVLTQQTHDTE
jgi:cell shape-determining protein MreC